jgi:hypothetical protein
MAGGGGGSFDPSGDISQWLGLAAHRIMQNYNDLGLTPAGQNAPGAPGFNDAPPQFPSGTPFAGQTPGFPPGTPAGTLPTATSMDLSGLNLQAQGAFAPVVDAQNALNAQAQSGASGAGGLLSGLGGLSSLGGL